MPFVAETTLQVRKANALLAGSYFPRVQQSIFPKLSRPYTTTSLHEPFTVIGAMPPMKLWNGSMPSAGLPSWQIDIPNLLWKNIIDIDRTEFEGDQTLTLEKKAPECGVILSRTPDRILLKRIIAGHTAGSMTVVFQNQTFSYVMDGVPFFSTAHNNGSPNGTQSNILQSTLPATVASVVAQDPGVTETQIQLLHAHVVNFFQTVTDNQGELIWPNLDPSKQVVYLTPAILAPFFKGALLMAGVIGGSPGGAQGATTNAFEGMCKEVISSGLLAGFPDPELRSGNVTPSAATDVYAFVVDDYVAPFYQSLFVPPGPGDIFPKGYNISSEVDRMLKEANTQGIKVGKTEVALYAGSVVEHNLDAVGSNATRDVVEGEKFFISGRMRGNMGYGAWFTACKVTPTGYSS